MKKTKIGVGVIIVSLLAYLLTGTLTLTDILDYIIYLHEEYLILSLILYTVLYTAVTLAGIPGATVFNLAAGFLFGFAGGAVMGIAAGGAAAVASFLVGRYLFRSWVTHRVHRLYADLNREITQHPIFYAFFLRLIPGIPFPLLNMTLGVTGIAVIPYWAATCIGLIPYVLILSYAGTQLQSFHLDETGRFFTPGLLLSFFLAGTIPLAARFIWKYYRKNATGKEPQ
jgi:uncharacterized membrane protein YdjX (TVP38/TMEM64 family)